MGDYWTNAVRHPEDTGVAYIRRTITFDRMGNDPNGLPIGCIEAGAIIQSVHVTKEAAFNGTSPTLDIGSAAAPSGAAASAQVQPGSTGYSGSLTGGSLVGYPMAVDTVIYAKMGGSGQTAGKAEIWITFIPKREGTGIPFPAN